MAGLFDDLIEPRSVKTILGDIEKAVKRSGRQDTQAMERVAIELRSAAGALQEAGRRDEQTAYALEGVRNEIDNLTIQLGRGFAGLGALFDWKMSTAISLLEQQQTTLYEVRDLLKYPRRTQANEDKEDGRQALRTALMADQNEGRETWLGRALDFFRSAAEKNPFDYTAQLDMGLVLLELQNQPETSIPHFQEAAQAARGAGDAEYESKSYFYLGRAQHLCGRTEAAYTASRRALDLQPENTVAVYECARYCALTGRIDECVRHVETLVRADAIGGKVTRTEAEAWWAKVQADTDFTAARYALNNLFNCLITEARAKAEESLERAKKAVETAEKARELVGEQTGLEKHLEDIRRGLEYVDRLSAVGDYFSHLDSLAAACEEVTAGFSLAGQMLGTGVSMARQRVMMQQKSINSATQPFQDKRTTLQVKLADAKKSLIADSGLINKDNFERRMVWLLSFIASLPLGIGMAFLLGGVGADVTTIFIGAVLVFFSVPLAIPLFWRYKKTSRLQALVKDVEQEERLTLGPLRADLARLETNQQRLEDALGRVRRGEYL